MASLSRRSASLLVVALLGAACTEVGDPIIATASNTTVVDDAEAAVATEGEVAVTGGPTATTVFSPRADPDYVPTLIVSAGGAVYEVDATTITPIVDAEASSVADAADDLSGGIVAELASDTEGATIDWFASGGSSFVQVDATGGALLDVTYADGSPEVLVLLEDGLDRVERISLVTGARTPLAALGDGESLLDVAAAAGRYLLVSADQACGGLRFLSADGEDLNLVGPPEAECPVPRRPAFGLGALSPEGDAVAFTELTYRSDGLVTSTDVVVWELGADAELARVTVAGSGEAVLDLAFDGRRVAVLRLDASDDAAPGEVVEIYDPVGAGDVVTSVPLAGATAVRFSRLPVAVSLLDVPIPEGDGGDG